jgi:flagellar motor switch protein FliG
MITNSVGSMQYGMNQMQGMGQSKGAGNQMKEMMQQLPEEDRASIREQMQNLDPTQRKEIMGQISQINTSDMSVEELSASLLSLFDPTTEDESKESSYPDSSFSIYA